MRRLYCLDYQLAATSVLLQLAEREREEVGRGERKRLQPAWEASLSPVHSSDLSADPL